MKVLPGLGKATTDLHLHIFFYSAFLLLVVFVKGRTLFHLELTGSNASQGTSMWLQPKKHFMSSLTTSRELQGFNNLCRMQVTLMSTRLLFLAHTIKHAHNTNLDVYRQKPETN